MVTSTADVPDPSGVPSSGRLGRVDGAASVELSVEGMHCGACVALIEESLIERSGVSAAAVDLESGRAVVHYDAVMVGPDDLRATVAEAGYSATVVG